MLLVAGLFFLSQAVSYWNTKSDYREIKPNLGKVMFYPYVRIIPMHLIIIVACIIQDKGIMIDTSLMLLLFLALKTVADVGMYIYQRRGFEDTPEIELQAQREDF